MILGDDNLRDNRPITPGIVAIRTRPSPSIGTNATFCKPVQPQSEGCGLQSSADSWGFYCGSASCRIPISSAAIRLTMKTTRLNARS